MKDKRLGLALLGAAVLLMVTYGFGSDKDKDKDKDTVMVFHGAIEDSQCAFNVHSDTRSHDWMIKKGVQGATDEKSCTQHCVKDMGGLYVLVVKNDVYRLDDQTTPEPFA